VSGCCSSHSFTLKTWILPYFIFLLGGWGAGPPTKENELFGLGYLSYSMVVVMLIFVWLALWVVTDK
jgi:hypothetical protein